MKVTFIADLHGEDLWKKVIDKESDLFVFLGDYFDSFTITHKQQLDNFKDILYFAENNKDKVKLLLGNHDIHYLLWHTPYYDYMKGSGFSSSLVWKVNNLYEEHKHLFQLAWQKGNILVTHAGLTQNYYDKVLKEFHKNESSCNYADLLNKLWSRKSELLMRIGKSRGGPEEWGGVFWCDISELIQSPLHNIIQVVGHTPLEDIKEITVDDKTKLYFIDCLIYREDKQENPKFFEMEIDDINYDGNCG
jgi:predicted phosphodiesterase